MNDHNLDDLIIGDPAPAGKRSKSFLAMIALVVIILLVGILLSKMILGTSEEEITVADKNQTEFVSPELIPMGNSNPKKSSDLKPIVKEKLPTPTKPKKQPVEKPVKKKEIIKVTKKKETTAKKTAQKKEEASKPASKKKPKPSALFGEGKRIYYIQIGAFNREPNPKFLKKIAGAGLKYIVNKNEKTRRVRVGPYGSYAEAKTALIDVNTSIGIMGFVVKQKQ